jgi:hypothetical protein
LETLVKRYGVSFFFFRLSFPLTQWTFYLGLRPMLVPKYLDRGREQLGVTTGEIMPDLDSNHTAMDRLYPTSHNASVNINIKGVSVNGSLSAEESIEKSTSENRIGAFKSSCLRSELGDPDG